MIIIDCDQRSSEWNQVRAGIPTASEFSRIIQQNGKPSKQRTDYLYQLIGERKLGFTEDGYLSYSMQLGVEREAEARRTFKFITDFDVKQVGFVFKDENRSVGCSPDALIDMNQPITKTPTGLEIKCPDLKNHMKTYHTQKVPTDKWTQIQGSMWVCGFPSWYFMSYYPGIEPVIIKVERNYKFSAALEYEMESFIKDLDELSAKLGV